MTAALWVVEMRTKTGRLWLPMEGGSLTRKKAMAIMRADRRLNYDDYFRVVKYVREEPKP